ncbi:MAG: multicopper oxidase domain-containing protein [Anaeromyxobacter sp.]
MTRTLPRSLPTCLFLLALAPAAGRADPLPLQACAEPVAGQPTCALHAGAGTLALPDGSTVPVWGYAAAEGGAVTSPGPVYVVRQGDQVTLTLHNDLGVATSLRLSGLSGAPELPAVAPGGSADLSFVAAAPGTYRYEAGASPGTQYQVAMGLHGVLVVRPAADGTAYGDPASAFDDEAVVVLSELDPALQAAAEPAAFDLRRLAPTWGLVNGRPYAGAAASDLVVPVSAGPRRLLLRYANAGSAPRAMALLGLPQALLAVDAARLPWAQRGVSQALGAGQTADAVVVVPGGLAEGSRYALYDASLSLHNPGQAGLGGMMTFLRVGAPGAGGGELRPTTGGVAVAPAATAGLSVTVSATVSSPGGDVLAAEAFLDAPGADGAGAALAVTAAPSVTASGALDVGAAASGVHAVHVHGRNAAGWGPFAVGTVRIDRAGPLTSAVAANPAATRGAAAVVVSATGDDRATGGSAVVAAELTIADPGNPAPLAMAAGQAGDVTGSP